MCEYLQEEEISYLNGKAIHKIIVIPRANLTVSCFVTNKLGDDVRTINVSSSKFMLNGKPLGWICLDSVFLTISPTGGNQSDALVYLYAAER